MRDNSITHLQQTSGYFSHNTPIFKPFQHPLIQQNNYKNERWTLFIHERNKKFIELLDKKLEKIQPKFIKGKKVEDPNSIVTAIFGRVMRRWQEGFYISKRVYTQEEVRSLMKKDWSGHMEPFDKIEKVFAFQYKVLENIEDPQCLAGFLWKYNLKYLRGFGKFTQSTSKERFFKSVFLKHALSYLPETKRGLKKNEIQALVDKDLWQLKKLVER